VAQDLLSDVVYMATRYEIEVKYGKNKFTNRVFKIKKNKVIIYLEHFLRGIRLSRVATFSRSAVACRYYSNPSQYPVRIPVGCSTLYHQLNGW